MKKTKFSKKLKLHQRKAVNFISINYKFLSIGLALGVVVVVFGVNTILNLPNYKISAEANRLIGSSIRVSSSKLTYASESKTYFLNQSAIGKSSTSNYQIGGNISDSSNYSLKIPENLSKGITVYDNKTNLSFTMTPDFSVAQGKLINDRFVYPLSNQSKVQDVYLIKNNGLKEDIIVNKEVSNQLIYKYSLDLPTGLEAKIMPSGAVGIYSANPALYGNISYGSSKDQSLVSKARENDPKNYLVFAFIAPTINQTGKDINDSAKASFTINGNQLTLTANNLSKLSYPISIDPSVLVTSATNFSYGGNNEGGLTISSAGNSISESSLTGGDTGDWSLGSSFNNARDNNQSVAYNGYIYDIGGAGSGSDYNDVQYAPINADGTIGTWQYTYNSASSSSFVGGFTNARDSFAAVTYNSYIYIMGGENLSSTKYNDVQYAPINADGTIGTWQYTYNSASSSSFVGGFTNARVGLSAIAYSGYLYLTSGYSGTTYYNDVQYAPINADGTIGTWQYTYNSASSSSFVGGFTNAREDQAFTTYNGYLYILGGTGSGGTFNDVQYAPINADGTIGTWQYTSDLLNNINLETASTYNGYIYVMGGSPNNYGSTSNVEYAEINSNGSLGAFTYTNTLLPGTYALGVSCAPSVEYNGYLYVVGGYNGNPEDGSDLLSTVQYAQINSAPGEIALYNTGGGEHFNVNTSYPTAEFGYGTAVENGYIYLIGGCTANSTKYCNTLSNKVYYADLNSSTLSWSTASNNLAVANFEPSVVAYDNQLYILGGCSATTATKACSSILATTYIATVSPTTGNTTSAWTSEAALTTARYAASAVVYDNYIYVIGGCTANTTNSALCGTVSSNVESVGLDSSGTYSGNFTSTGNLNTGVFNFAATVYRNRVYVVGGCKTSAANDSCTSISNLIQIGTMSSGSISWVNANTTLLVPVWGEQVTILNGFIYIVDGCNYSIGSAYYGCGSLPQENIAYASITIGSSSNDATSIGSLTDSTNAGNYREWSFGSVAYGNTIYIIGGCEGIATSSINGCNAMNNDVANEQINNGGSGSTDTWNYTYNSTNNGGTYTGGFTNGRGASSAVVYNGYIYLLGGTNGSTYYNDVQYAPINADGTIGTWKYTYNSASSGSFIGGFTTARTGQSAVVYNGYIYLLGGTNGSTYYNDVQYAPINADGTIGTWKYTYNSASSGSFIGGFTTARTGQSAVVYNGYIYLLGGTNGSTYYNDVQYAPINADGTIGTWASTTAFTTGRAGFISFVYNGHLYLLGGFDLAYNNDVQYAPINADGTIGTWASTTAFNATRGSVSGFVYNGYIYLLGGINTATYYNDVQYAPINNDGSIGNWQNAPNFNNVRAGQSSVVYNGNAYVLGGSNGSTYYNDVQFSGLQSTPRVGYYSKLINTDVDTQPWKIIANGTNTNNPGDGSIDVGGINFEYSFATNSCTSFNSLSIAENNQADPLGSLYNLSLTTNKCSTSTNVARYAMLRYEINDSNTVTFPDSGSNHSSINQISYYYLPNPGLRLRGGSTFTGGSLQSLSTPP